MVTLANPVHPGEILKEEFLEEMELTAGKLAKAIKVPRTRIERLVAHERGMSTDTAFRLARFLGTTPEFWLNLQRGYDVAMARKDEALAIALKEINPAVMAG